MFRVRKMFFLLFLVLSLFLVSCSWNTGDESIVDESTSDEFKINFNSNGGSEVDFIKTAGNSTVEIPLEPVKFGNAFNGWYLDNDTFQIPFTETSLSAIKLSKDLTVYAKWTANQYKITYGIITDEYNPTLHTLLYPGETIKQTFLGGDHAVAITSKDNIFTWGSNTRGQLGDGTTISRLKPVDITSQFNLGYGEKITKVFLGVCFSSAITSNGRIFTWGSNSNGELGDGTTTFRSTPFDITSQFNLSAGETITKVYLGTLHSLAITSIGRIFTWGANIGGELGDGTTDSKSIPIDITSQFNLNVGETIAEASLASFHSSAITSNGRVFTWGNNVKGQLGDGTKIDKYTPLDITPQFNLNAGETITKLSIRGYHSSAITSNNRIFTWGYNFYGELGDGTTDSKSTPVDITSRFNLSAGEIITKISNGYDHSAAITSKGRIFTWGNNSHGQLGDGTTINRSIPIDITTKFNLSAGKTIVDVTLSSYFSLVSISTGRSFVWGYNYKGQLGDGTTTDKYTPIPLSFYTPEITSEVTYHYGEEIIDNRPIAAGFTFYGWYRGIELTTLFANSTMPAENIILIGKKLFTN